jgi:hypothetical protein
MVADNDSDFDFLAGFAGEPGQFWPRFRAHAQRVMMAEGACILIQLPGQAVRVLSQDSAKSARSIVDSGLVTQLDVMTDGGLHEWIDGMAVASLSASAGSKLWLVLLEAASAAPAEAVRELRLLADSYQSRRREQRTGAQVEEISEVLDLGLNLGASGDFLNAALRLCHRLSSQLKATRVSLAWLESSGLKVLATSHGGRVNSDSHEAECMVRAMEEALDQNNEVAYPAIPGSQAITREHKIFSEQHESGAVLSVPLRDPVRIEVVGVLMIERAVGDVLWSELEIEHLRLASDLITPRLVALYESSGWLGRRIWRSLRRNVAGLLGVEHTGWKFASLLISLTVLSLALIRMEHKVRSPFLLKTDAAAIATAPFPGFIDEVRYHLGDVVRKDQVLVTLDRRELLLEEVNVIAARDKSEREARAYEAEGKLAESLMAKAASKQEDSKLGILRHRLAMTEIRAPFEGIVVEGDLRERLASPVQVGEQLFKVVQIRDLVGELQVDERDIGFLSQGQEGELAFASRPGDRFGVKIMHYEPVAEVREQGNVFKLRAQVQGEPQDWWRPGMSGVCKVNAGKASLLWIFTHRTIETIRMWLWL